MSDNTDQTPEWMLRLENKKKRPHRLAHEIGAGSPCLSCGDACPGLDLHFWRKLCRNCKCKKEEHDVKDDEGYEQFEILLGAGGKKRKTGGVLKMTVPEEGKPASVEPSNKGVAFDWVPPNVSDDLAAEYMQQLPARKMPISGSDGALYRRQQLEKQVPLHDLDASKCHNLSPEETEALTKYLENLKSNVVGQGCVTKVPVLYAESRLVMRGPHQLHSSSSQVLGRALASSQSADSIRTLPPIPPAYNSVPRPFQPNIGSNRYEDEDFPPPPLPDSLPPNLDLKTPSAFIPNWSLPQQQKLQDGTQSGVGVTGNVAHSGDVPGQQWVSSVDPSVAHLQSATHPAQHGLLGHYPAAGGSAVIQGGPGANTLHSENVSEQGAMFTAPLSSSGGSQGHPQDASLSLLNTNQGLSQSSAVPIHLGNYRQRVAGRGLQLREPRHGTLPSDGALAPSLPQDGSTVMSMIVKGLVQADFTQGQVPPQYSGDIKSQALAGSRLARGEVQGGVAANRCPGDVANSSAIPGCGVPGASTALGQNSAWKIEHLQDGGVRFRHDFAYSSDVPGQQMPGITGAVEQNGDPGMLRPQDGSYSQMKYPSGFAQSSNVPGQMMSGAIGQNGVPGTGSHQDGSYAQSSNIPEQMMMGPMGQNGPLGMEGPQDGSYSRTQYPVDIAQSSNVSGHRIPAMTASLGDHGIVPQYPTAPYEESMVAGTLPVDGVITSSLGPRGELVSSVAVATDALPKSAMVMQQSHPALGVEELANLMEQMSGSDGQEGAAQAHLDCPECTQAIHAGEVAVFAERAGGETAWHPQCFVCSTCKELLVDLIYFYHKGKVYCGRHFAELLNIPRCFACDELIFVKEYTVAEGKAFHVRHFCCYECDDPLAGKQYVPVDDQPVCLDCFDVKYGKRCHTCKQKITAGAQRVGWKDLNWHVEGNCFRCFECAKSLLGGRFVVKENQPFCSKECVQTGLPKICAA